MPKRVSMEEVSCFITFIELSRLGFHLFRNFRKVGGGGGNYVVGVQNERLK